MMALLHGTTNPTAGVGANGDYYVNTATLYGFGPKATGAWPAGASMAPAAGATDPAIKAVRDGYVALALESDAACYIGERPPAISTACTVLHPYGGAPGTANPLDDYRFQVEVYDPSQAAGYAKVEAAKTALHRRHGWTLVGYTAASVHALTAPMSLPAVDAQGVRLYRVEVNIRLALRPNA